jgi:hypothetical protein
MVDVQHRQHVFDFAQSILDKTNLDVYISKKNKLHSSPRELEFHCFNFPGMPHNVGHSRGVEVVVE